MIQAEKPEEDKQFSFEKLGIEDWRIEVLTGRELMELGNFVETSGERSDSLLLWRHNGRNVTMGDLMDEVINNGTEIKEPASNWVDNVLPPKYDPERIKQAIENHEIDIPLVFFPTFNGKELRKLGLLNRGNILDGDRRIMNVVRFLKDQTPEYIDNFKLTAFVGRVDLAKYAAFNLYYFAEPWVRRSKDFVRKFLGKEVDHIDDEYSLKFFEQWYLVLERVGFIRKGNKARIN